MRGLALNLALAAALTTFGASCASAPVEFSPMEREAALNADLLDGGTIDLNADLAAGRPVALVYWQSW